MDEIRIKGLKLFAHHGVYEQERADGQFFYVDAVLSTDLSKAGMQDELGLTTNYGEVCRFLNEWLTENTCQLIEAAAEGAARQILLRFPRVMEVELELHKPQAPIGLPFGDVSVRVKRGWHKVYLSIGSNLGDREAFLRGGIEELSRHPDIRLGKVSDFLETKPYGGVEQGMFLNGALELDTLLAPLQLMEQLHRIESLAGRERLVHWGPRTLDLDILFFDKLVYEDEHLVIPHVDMQNRYFVLKPMAQIAPNIRHPILQKTIQELLEALE